MAIPIYYPSLAECQNLRKYCDAKQYESPMGICKLHLPADLNVHSLSADVLATMRCKRPVYQTQFHPKIAGWCRLGLRSQKTRSIADVWATSRPPLDSPAEFWATFGTQKPLYGSDCDGTAFTTNSLHLNALFPNALQSLRVLKGINTPYLYLGTAGSAFAIHVEDLDTFSVNYMHGGAPKIWYTFARTDNAKFEQLMRQHYPADARACPEFIRHKVYLPAPHILEAAGIKVAMMEQHARDLIVTFPSGYHYGYNQGINVSEAINFVTASWVPLGQAAHWCDCVKGTLKINFAELVFPADELFTPQELYCTCQKEWDASKPMLQCDVCLTWYHYECVGVNVPYEDATYTCPTCCSPPPITANT